MTRVFAVVLATTLLVGCGDDDGGAVDAQVSFDAQPTPDAGAVDASLADTLPVAGKLTIVSPALTGLTGKIMLVFVLDGASRVAGTCDPISMDPQTITTVAKIPNAVMGDPCALGGEATLAAGVYDISAGIYTPGMMTPEACATTTATVDGDSMVTLPALGACN